MLDELTRYEEFRRAARQQGFTIAGRGDAHGRVLFVFDLNQGTVILVDPTPERVRQLVELARQYAQDPSFGEQQALLSLIACRSELEYDIVSWERRYYVDHSCQSKWISLNQWLQENDQDPRL